MKECQRCLFNETIAQMGEEQCEYCDLHDELERQANPLELKFIVKEIRKKGYNKTYDCIMGISGGIDSSILLFTAVKYWNLKPLVIHFDNHWNAPEAVHNMTQLVKLLGVDSITYTVNKEEYDRLNDAFLWAGVPDGDDEAFATELLAQYNVTVLPGRYLAREVNGVNPGQGRIRMALVAQPQECLEAAQRIVQFVQSHYPPST